MTKKNPNGTDIPLQDIDGLEQVKAKIKSIEPGYKDPLHFTREELTVRHGKRGIMLNKRLLDRQNAWEELDTLKALHKEKLEIYEKMDNTDCPAALVVFDKQLNEIEFKLQDAWGFERNANFFRIWERPKCTCPKMDNEDRYPYGHIISGGCVLHGGYIEKGD